MRGSLFLLTIGLLVSGACAQGLREMPGEITARWQTSLTASEGWNTPGHRTGGWVKPVVVPGRYPAWMQPEWQALGRFIWHPSGANTGKPVYFRRNLWLPGEVEEALVHVVADDEFALYANGLGIARGHQPHQDFVLDLKEALQPGANVIAVQARDLAPAGYGLLVVPQIVQRWPLAGWQYASSLSGAGWTSGKEARWSAAVPDPAPPIMLEGLGAYACLSVPGGMKDFSTAYFHRTLEVDGLPLQAHVVILGDDGWELYANGRLVDMEKRPERAYLPRKVDLTEFLQAGRNHLAVKVTNDWGPGRLYCVPTVGMTF